jgi:multiple sugar transport system substrate-binding protein
MPNNGLGTVPTMREHLASFRREHPGLRLAIWVRTETSMWRHLFRLLKNPRQDPRPDVVQIPSHWTGTLSRLGMLQELGSLDPSLDLGRWPAALRDHCRAGEGGQVYSLPWWIGIRVLYYRKDALRRAGVDPASDLKDWDGLKSACRKLAARWKSTSGRTHPVANPNPRESVSLRDVAPCVWGRGGDFFASDGTRSLLQREASFRGVADYFDLVRNGWMPLKGPSGLAPRDLFDGSAALQISGRLPRGLPRRPNARRSAEKARAELGAVPYPNGGGRTLLTSQNLAILADSELQRESFALLRELAFGSAGVSYASAIGALPSTERGTREALRAHPELEGAFTESLERARMLPPLGSLGTLEKVFDRSMDRVVQDIVGGRFSERGMREELIFAGSEIDTILSLSEKE